MVFLKKYELEKEATSIIKIQQVLGSIGLEDVRICIRDGPFTNR